MTKQIGWMIILSIIILFSSCRQPEVQVKDEKQERIEQKKDSIEIVNEKSLTDIKEKYDLISLWDMNRRAFTYALQETFIDENKLLSVEGKIDDISKMDSTYSLKIYEHRTRYEELEYLIHVSISKEKFVEFRKIIESDNYSNSGYFIIKVSEIISSSPMKEISININDGYSYSNLNFDKKQITFKGDLIDYHIDELLPRNYE